MKLSRKTRSEEAQLSYEDKVRKYQLDTKHRIIHIGVVAFVLTIFAGAALQVGMFAVGFYLFGLSSADMEINSNSFAATVGYWAFNFVAFLGFATLVSGWFKAPTPPSKDESHSQTGESSSS